MDLGFITIIRISNVYIGTEAKRTKEPIIRIKSSYLPTEKKKNMLVEVSCQGSSSENKIHLISTKENHSRYYVLYQNHHEAEQNKPRLSVQDHLPKP